MCLQAGRPGSLNSSAMRNTCRWELQSVVRWLFSHWELQAERSVSLQPAVGSVMCSQHLPQKAAGSRMGMSGGCNG